MKTLSECFLIHLCASLLVCFTSCDRHPDHRVTATRTIFVTVNSAIIVLFSDRGLTFDERENLLKGGDCRELLIKWLTEIDKFGEYSLKDGWDRNLEIYFTGEKDDELTITIVSAGKDVRASDDDIFYTGSIVYAKTD